jgi:hypothetical protein
MLREGAGKPLNVSCFPAINTRFKEVFSVHSVKGRKCQQLIAQLCYPLQTCQTISSYTGRNDSL